MYFSIYHFSYISEKHSSHTVAILHTNDEHIALEYPTFFRHRKKRTETLLIQCYLIISTPTVQSSMTSIFKEIFYYATTLHKNPTFFGWVVTKTGFSTFSKRGNRKSPLYLKATIHFDSSRTTRKVGSFSFTDFSKWASLVSSILLFLLL